MPRTNKRDRAAFKQIATTNLGALTVSTANAVASVGVPTKAEFDAVVALANELKADLNALIAALKV